VLNVANAGQWVAEDNPGPLPQLSIIAGAVLQPRKLAVTVSFSRELSESSLIADIAQQIISEASALALDAAMFGSQASTAAIPSGILFGVTPITGTVGGGINALTGDFRAMFQALAANGAGKGAIFVAAPQQVASLKAFVGPRFDFEVLASAALAAGTVIAIEPSSFCSGFDFAPEFTTSTTALMHFDDTTPIDIGTPGTPPTVAAPAKSLFQTEAIALRMRLRAAWAMRAQGHVQLIQNASW
jgi:hypothetical protein